MNYEQLCVRAGMVKAPGDYRWSSYGYNAFANEDKHIASHPIYQALGKSEKERCYAYRELFRYTIDDHLLHEIRETVNLELVLGREDFKDRIEQMLQRKVRKGTPDRPCVKESDGVYYIY